MPRKKQLRENAFVFFDVVYEDGTRRSNRKIAVSDLDPVDTAASARALLEAQDRKIAAISGRSPGTIKSIARSAQR